jgi:small nuclear ribonucleoprotein (snRNP)-like protein
MNIKEVAAFADRFATHNERIIITLKDNSELRGHFINNPKLEKKIDNYWNFVILRIDNEENTKMVINGDDILSIKKVIIF